MNQLGSNKPTVLQGQLKVAHHRERIAHRDEAEGSFWLNAVAPLRKSERGSILTKTNDILPSFNGEASLSDIEKWFTQVDDIDSIELGDREVFVHGFNVPTFSMFG